MISAMPQADFVSACIVLQQTLHLSPACSSIQIGAQVKPAINLKALLSQFTLWVKHIRKVKISLDGTFWQVFMSLLCLLSYLSVSIFHWHLGAISQAVFCFPFKKKDYCITQVVIVDWGNQAVAFSFVSPVD